MDHRNRRRWFDAYVSTIVSRDVAEFAGARRTREIPRLLRAVTARTANQLVVSTIHCSRPLWSTKYGVSWAGRTSGSR